MSAAILAFARVGFLDMMAFRLRYYTGIVTYFINVTIYYFIWQAIFRASPGFGGFDLSEIITYVCVGWIIRSMYFNNIDNDMASDVLEGKIVMSMMKPVSVQTIYVARSLGEAAFRMIMLTAPTAAVIGFVFPLKPPAGPLAFAGFLAALAGSVLLVCFLNFIVGSCAVRLTSILGLLRAKFWMQELLSGLLVPLTLFPPPLRAVSAWLPFEHIGYTPMMIYLGKLSGREMARVLALDLAWILALASFGAWFWRAISRKITVHGG